MKYDEDDRVRCDRDCARYRPQGRKPVPCEAAAAGELFQTPVNYAPMLDPPRRCEGFRPKPGATDQRTAQERWPAYFVALDAARDAAAPDQGRARRAKLRNERTGGPLVDTIPGRAEGAPEDAGQGSRKSLW